MLKCPRCGETDPRIVETTPDGRFVCDGCDTVWTPDDVPRLPLAEPERVRRDLDG